MNIFNSLKQIEDIAGNSQYFFNAAAEFIRNDAQTAIATNQVALGVFAGLALLLSVAYVYLRKSTNANNPMPKEGTTHIRHVKSHFPPKPMTTSSASATIHYDKLPGASRSSSQPKPATTSHAKKAKKHKTTLNRLSNQNESDPSVILKELNEAIATLSSLEEEKKKDTPRVLNAKTGYQEKRSQALNAILQAIAYYDASATKDQGLKQALDKIFANDKLLDNLGWECELKSEGTHLKYLEKALYFYKKAKDLGNQNAKARYEKFHTPSQENTNLRNLCFDMANGLKQRPSPKSKDTAIMYFRSAKALGHPLAEQALQELR